MPVRTYEYWPFMISLDLARSSVEECSQAVRSELIRIAKGSPLQGSERHFDSLSEVFAHPMLYYQVPTRVYVIPTKTKWSVIWTNSFHCSGYNSLCYCLTLNRGIETIHSIGSDENAFHLAGTTIQHRCAGMDEPVERLVQAAVGDSDRWLWHENGPIQPYENADYYSSRRIRDRLNEAILEEYLMRIGCNPRDKAIYDFDKPVYCFVRTELESTLSGKPYSYIAERCQKR